jgi:hypothetical protein
MLIKFSAKKTELEKQFHRSTVLKWWDIAISPKAVNR